MDSLTQAALGATVGHAILGAKVGSKIGRLAPVWGAALGTLPDLDVLIPYGGVVEDFTYHRGFSHSLLVQALVTPLLVWLAIKIHPQTHEHKLRWGAAILAIFWTHSLLDAFTVYGTQLLWPITEYPFGISSLFIIDLAYTLPLLIGLGIAAYVGWNSRKARIASVCALVISSSYLAWSLVAKSTMKSILQETLVQQNMNVYAVLTTPMPLNTLLWRVVAINDQDYYVAHVAVWDSPESVDFRAYPKGEELLSDIADQWNVQRLQWFTKGFYRAELVNNEVVMTDLRMGLEDSYVFNFAVGKQVKRSADSDSTDRSENKESSENGNVSIEPMVARRTETLRDMSRLPLLWDRFFDNEVSLHPEPIISARSAPEVSESE